MSPTEYVTIQSFDHRIQADMLLMVLNQHDIPARLADEHIVAMEWMLSNAIGGIKVQVPAVHESNARNIASTHQSKPNSRRDEGSPETDDDACLSCGFSIPEDRNVCPECGWSYDES